MVGILDWSDVCQAGLVGTGAGRGVGLLVGATAGCKYRKRDGSADYKYRGPEFMAQLT